MKAPFPWFGGKSRASELIWSRFGDVPNYVEPFAGSLAVLLSRPHDPHTETVNDLDCYLANFWRAIRFDPETTAQWADSPVNEADLLARHRWLVKREDFRERVKADAEWFDAKVAGWWVWGLCAWIGSGWCVQRGNGDQPSQIPHLGDAGRVENSSEHHKRPHLMTNGKGINAANRGTVHDYFESLSERLRRVRVCCGDWSRCLGESVTTKHGVTAVMLDPPYSADRSDCYSVETDCSAAVREWAIANGNNQLLRIALCGYESEHAMPDNWECVAWKAQGGYGSQSDGRGRDNAKRERIWFSPACLKVDGLKQQGLAL
jgi:site-specific DNA-adenine methylase